MDVNEEIEARWDELVMEGVIVPSCVDPQGNVTFTFDMELLEKEEPDLYHRHCDEVDDDLISLYNKGLVNIDFSGDEVVYSLTEKGSVYAEAILKSLTE